MNEHTQSGIYDLAQTPSGEIIMTLHFTKELMKQTYLFPIQVCSEIIAVCPDHIVLHSCSGAVPQVIGINDRSNACWWP